MGNNFSAAEENSQITQIEELQKYSSKLESKNEKLVNSLEDVKTVINDTNTENEMLENSNKILEKRSSDLEKELSTEKEQNRLNLSKIYSLQKKNKLLEENDIIDEKEIQKLQEQIVSLQDTKQSLSNIINKLEHENNLLQSKNDDIEFDLEKKNEENQMMENDISSLKKVITENINDAEYLKKEIDHHLSRVSECENIISNYEDELYTNTKKIDELIEKNDVIEIEKEKLVDENLFKNEKINEFEQMIEKLQSKINSMESIYKIKARSLIQKNIKKNIEKKIRFINTFEFKEDIVKQMMDNTWIPNSLEQGLCDSLFDVVADNICDFLRKDVEK